MSFQGLTPEDQYRRVLGACDSAFRLRVLLVDGTEIPGEYAAFSGSPRGSLSIWDETGAEFDIPSCNIKDVLPPSVSLVGYI